MTVRKSTKKPIGMKVVLAALLLWTMTGCASSSSQHEAGSNSENPGTWDVDSRNNENPSLGAKSIDRLPKPSSKISTFDTSAAHENSHLVMNRDLATQLKKDAQLQEAAVAMTNNNIYVAAAPSGMKAASKGEDAQQQALRQGHDPASGAGIFGNGFGNQVDWITNVPLPTDSARKMKETIQRIYPDANVFISTNPHFVSRMMFYNQQQGSKSMDLYLNEFNTMVQYAFPDYATGQKSATPVK
ncbi:YhcN/YlaJ family sporulation lipoprotein [Paenibacillus hexagrammi]|uniref:YhcN/YlaJ family sporulation lipoprotein n=1 Tax=Paenibacillus hexagrammi TaxID=2908839 RepID=A0ABY3SS42_9BACL|nr:YhcN/YlaJ family sporulation lipoprotein [Paenibacillus sp. YPD9-1]UJF35935.1 YhcN/YlaJ family sporulation lipoprotein [Paenibacillus sp. YPD9-1]